MGSKGGWGQLMGSPIAGAVTGIPFVGEGVGMHAIMKEAKSKMELPNAPELPPEVEEIDIAGKKQYTKQKLKSKKGRQSTILSGLGTSSGGKKKTVLG